MRRILATAYLLVGLGAAAGADSLSDVPAAWADRLAPIPEQKLEELETSGAARIRETRSRLDGLLQSPDASATELAAAYGRLGALYAAHRLAAGAELAFRNARTLDHQAFPWAYYSAHLALEHGQAEQALEYLAQARRLDPAYPTLPLRRGEALLGLNRLEEARAAYLEVVNDPGLRPAALYGLAQIDLLERDWQAAADRLDEVLELQPSADAVHYPLGQALVRLGRRDEAREHLAQRGLIKPEYPDALVTELHSLQRGAQFHFEEAMGAVNRGDHAAASAAFAAGLAEDADNARARTSYARTLWIAGHQDEAVEQLRRAARDGPDETLPRFLLAVVEDAANDPAAAAAGYREVLRLDPDHQGALSYLASLELREGRDAEAAEHFARAIAAGANLMPVYLHYWGALYGARTDPAVLRDKLVEFDRHFPEPPVFRYLLSRLLISSSSPGAGERTEAVEIARGLQETQPIPPHTELLALALAAEGRFAEAAELQQGLVAMARQAGAEDHAARLAETLERYRAEALPEPIWPQPDPMFVPPPADPESPMRNYPSPHPY